MTQDKPNRARAVRKADYEALAAFRHELRVFLSFSEAAARAAGLTPQQHQGLLVIKGLPGADSVSVGELADLLLIRHNSAVELANRLCAAGLLERTPDPNDRRRVRLSLTPAAEDLLRDLSAAHVQELQRMRPVLRTLLGILHEDEAAADISG